MKEKSYRTLIKCITWRVLATDDTFVFSWLITGKVKIAISIGLVEVVTKIILYFLHERIWNKVNLGRTIKQPEYQI